MDFGASNVIRSCTGVRKIGSFLVWVSFGMLIVAFYLDCDAFDQICSLVCSTKYCSFFFQFGLIAAFCLSQLRFRSMIFACFLCCSRTLFDSNRYVGKLRFDSYLFCLPGMDTNSGVWVNISC